MKARCYYCNKELTERTIKRHMKNCSEMKETIDKELAASKSRRKQYILSVKDKYRKDYCIYLSIDASLQLCHIDQFIRDVWVECCGHLSTFIIDGMTYMDNRESGYQMNTKLNDILNIGQKFEYEYDFGSTTYLTLEVIDLIDVSKKHSQIEIIARNNEEGRPNSPREGECGYVCDEEAENIYLPGNSKKYKPSSKKPVVSNDMRDFYNDFDDILDNYSDEELEQLLSDYHENMNNEFNKNLEELFQGIYSFDIEEIIKSYKKNQLIGLSEGMNLSIPHNLKKKDFAEKLFEEYESAAETIISRLDKERYKVLNEGMKKKGIIKAKEGRLQLELTLFQLGLIFPSNDNGMRIYTIPKLVQDILSKNDTINFRKKIKDNTEMVKIISGMVYAYGIVSFRDIESTLTNMGYNFEDINEIIYTFLENKNIEVLCDYILSDEDGNPELLVNKSIEDYNKALRLIYENNDFQTFSKDKLMMMGTDDYLQHSSLGRDFKDNLLNLFCMAKDDAEEYTNMMALDVQYRSSEEVIDDVFKGIDTELDNDEQRMVRNVMNEFLKNIPLWRLGGFTINEVEKREAKKQVKGNGDSKVIDLFSSKRK